MVARDILKREADPEYQPTNTEIIKKRYGWPHKSARVNSTTVINSKGVQLQLNTIRETFNNAVPDDSLVKEYKRCLRARVKIRDKSGKVIDTEHNYPIKIRAVETGFKAKGLISDAPQTDARSISITISPDDVKRMDSIARHMSALTEQILSSPRGRQLVKQPNTQPNTSIDKHIQSVDDVHSQSLVKDVADVELVDTKGGSGGTPTPPSTSITTPSRGKISEE